jgi:hypothetical protein
MSTTYLVTLTSGRIAEVVADDLTTRADGALFLMAAVAKPPAALVTVAVFAARTWTSCVPKDSTPWSTSTSRPPMLYRYPHNRPNRGSRDGQSQPQALRRRHQLDRPRQGRRTLT